MFFFIFKLFKFFLFIIYSDVILKEARIINNCFEETNNLIQINKDNDNEGRKIKMNKNSTNYNFHPYICVIAIFEEVDSNNNPFKALIQYEFIAQNILRYRENTNTINSLVWYYDNYKRLQVIENIKFSLEFIGHEFKNSTFSINKNSSEINLNSLIGYPDNFITEIESGKNSTLFTWILKSIPENEFQKISLELPIFNKNCRKLVYKF